MKLGKLSFEFLGVFRLNFFFVLFCYTENHIFEDERRRSSTSNGFCFCLSFSWLFHTKFGISFFKYGFFFRPKQTTPMECKNCAPKINSLDPGILLASLKVSYAVPQLLPSVAEKALDLANELSPKQYLGPQRKLKKKV